MPIATPEVYAQMLDRAKEHGFAYPAINVTSSQTLNAALRGFADADSDGIIQVSTGGADYLSGAVKNMVTGAVALAHFARSVAVKYPVNIALHTDHCPKDKLDGYMRPLVALSRERVARGEEPLFQSHMWDGSAVPLAENLAIASELLGECAQAHVIMEMEIGVVGGEEDGVVGEINEKLYSTVDDALAVAEALGLGERGRYILAATFGNVHGVYKPGHVSLRPPVLNDIQEAVGAKYGKDKPFELVFHGGSGSALTEIREAISYGVVKMNVDTDTQYTFTRPIAGHMFAHYDGVLKIDGEVGDKKAYDPRSYGKAAEAGMAARVVEACEDLMSAGKHQPELASRTAVGHAGPMVTPARRVAVLSDIHGVMPALTAVLAEPEVAAADLIVLTGDLAAGPQPVETLDRLVALGDRAVWIRGNADRELVEYAHGERTGMPDEVSAWAAGELRADQVELLAGLPLSRTIAVAGLGGVLFCHATPRDDEEVVVADTRLDRWQQVFDGVAAEVSAVVCGHTHMPFIRLAHGRMVINPGSVGMPYGQPGAHWALLGPGAELRRTVFDTDAACRLIAAGSGFPGARAWADLYLRGTITDAEALAVMGPRDGRA